LEDWFQELEEFEVHVKLNSQTKKSLFVLGRKNLRSPSIVSTINGFGVATGELYGDWIPWNCLAGKEKRKRKRKEKEKTREPIRIESFFFCLLFVLRHPPLFFRFHGDQGRGVQNLQAGFTSSLFFSFFLATD